MQSYLFFSILTNLEANGRCALRQFGKLFVILSAQNRETWCYICGLAAMLNEKNIYYVNKYNR